MHGSDIQTTLWSTFEYVLHIVIVVYYQTTIVKYALPMYFCYKLTIEQSNLFHLALLLTAEAMQGNAAAGEGQLLVLAEGRTGGVCSAVLTMLRALRDPLLTHDGCPTCYCNLYSGWSNKTEAW